MIDFQTETKFCWRKSQWVSKPSNLYNINFQIQFFSSFSTLLFSVNLKILLYSCWNLPHRYYYHQRNRWISFTDCVFSFQYWRFIWFEKTEKCIWHSAIPWTEVIDLFFLQYINKSNETFVDRMELPKANARLNNLSNQVILLGRYHLFHVPPNLSFIKFPWSKVHCR